MQVLRKSTTVLVIVGPVLDFSGLPVTDAVLSDFNLNENGSTSTLGLPSSSSHSHNGHYLISLDGSHVSAEGRLEITSNNLDHAMPPARFQVVSQAVYDVMYGEDAVGPIPSDTLELALPLQAVVESSDSCGLNIVVFYGEEKTISITLHQQNGDPFDFTGMDLVLCIQKASKINLEVFETGDLTIVGNTISFETTTANLTVGQHLWSLRLLPDNVVLSQGHYNVRKAALA